MWCELYLWLQSDRHRVRCTNMLIKISFSFGLTIFVILQYKQIVCFFFWTNNVCYPTIQTDCLLFQRCLIRVFWNLNCCQFQFPDGETFLNSVQCNLSTYYCISCKIVSMALNSNLNSNYKACALWCGAHWRAMLSL